MLISVRHITRYTYARTLSYSVQSLRMTPATFEGQRVLDWTVTGPDGAFMLPFRDSFGNPAYLMTLSGPLPEIAIIASGTVDTEDRNGVVKGLAEISPPRVYLRQTDHTQPDDAIHALASEARKPGSLDTLHALSALVRERMTYKIGTTDATTTAAGALRQGSGVCQDFSHIIIAAARSLGIPARYVTGYLVDSTQTAEAHHAWMEGWVEDLGWIAFDAVNAVCPTERYVRLACGLDANLAAPIRGARRGGDEERLSVAVDVAHQTAQQQQ
ncbi:MAG: transglutaminase domain-containing protein [Hyphomicrobiaceae bacterium]